MTDIDAALESEGYEKGTEKYDVERLKREMNVIKEDYDSERTAAKSVSFGILYGMSE